MTERRRTGRIELFVLEDEEGNFRFVDRSQQLKDPKYWWTEFGLIPPPYNPDALSKLLEKNTWHRRCSKQIASDTAGLGFTLRPSGTFAEGKSPSTPNEIQEFLDHPNTDANASLRSIFEAGQVDFESIGWMAFELVRTKGGKPTQLWHMPASTVRIHKSKKLFCQIVATKKTWFKAYKAKNKDGSDLQVNKDTGETEEDLGERIPEDLRGNEVIYLKNYASNNTYYGIPNIITALGAVTLLLGIRDFNIDFFGNNAIPAWAVIVEGGEITEEVRKKIEKHLKSLKGSGGAHSTIIVGCDDENVKIRFERLSDEVKEGSFKGLGKDSRDEIIVSHGVPPHRIGIMEVGSLGGNIALEMTRVYKNSMVSPRQEDLETVMNNLLSEFTNGKKEWLFKFAEIDLTDEILDVRLSRMLAEVAALTPNQIIKRLGLGETFEGGDNHYISRSLVPVGEAGATKPRDRVPSKDEKVPAKDPKQVPEMDADGKDDDEEHSETEG